MKAFGLVCLLLFAAPLGAGAGDLSFNRDIKPLLSDRCFKCHGPDGGEFGERWKGGLRLDTQEGAFADLVKVKNGVANRKRAAKGQEPLPEPKASRFAIVPGDPDSSVLVDRISTEDENDRMPPPDSHLSLSPEEIELLKRWVAAGAPWEGHWAFQRIRRPAPPALDDPWIENEVDAFVLAKLNARSIKPARPADPAVWLRRVTLDLTGLPPAPAEVDAFVADRSPDARRKVVDRLLQSVDYAERMTMTWLDNARYADSNGFQFDNERTMWPWRDWVIEAFRANMPYDEFITEQLAGDLLPEPTQAQRIATGFNRNHGYSIEGGIIDEEYRVDYANDKTTTAGTLFLGLTLDCTRCHDHKYDPLSMTDYYSFFAFFNTSAEKGAPGEGGRKQKTAPPFLEVVSGAPTKKAKPMVMKEAPRKSFVLLQGQFDQPGAEVTPRTPDVLPGFHGYTPNRMGLARWLLAEDNPLFARVTVNRFWQQFFGIGIVKTPDNFGLQGDSPSHPRLLDWLASEFREKEWDLHHLIRTIVLSATYGQSSDFRSDVGDPENRLLARGPSFRLSAEMIRDQALATSGLLSPEVGGPSVKPYQPDGVWEDLNAPTSHAEVYRAGKGEALYRKTMYTYWRRAVLHPALLAFDAPSRDVCSVNREETNTPLQALVTLHGPTYIEAARMLAARLQSSAQPIREAFRTVLTREASKREHARLKALYEQRRARYRGDPAAVKKLFAVGATPQPAGDRPADTAALADVCHALFNLSETITRK